MPSDVICHVTTKVLVAAKKGINKQGKACRQQGAGDEISSGRNWGMGGVGVQWVREKKRSRRSLDKEIIRYDEPVCGQSGAHFFFFFKGL